MTEQTRSGLRELQRLDDAILGAEKRVKDLELRLAEVERPAQDLDGEVGTTRSRLQEMRLEERRVELAGDEKADRMKKLEDRLGSVRNVREESAVSAEIEMVRRARESDEQEALSLLDQIRRLEDRLEEQSEALEEARSEVAPRRDELESEREAALAEAARLKEERDAFAATLPKVEIRLYDAIRVGGRRALAPLTEDGACGNCFTMIPPQLQNEIRHGSEMIRCEGCGVIIVAPLPEDLEPAPTAEVAEDGGGEDDAVTGEAEAPEAEPADDVADGAADDTPA
ncbi:MAG TPA: C4-type zinc ribbon domain-containing protein [Longimicrobiales bacterium]|nr:C4-type zinc ribbon domain-containing protein [Longimicrobiales bacterium]